MSDMDTELEVNKQDNPFQKQQRVNFPSLPAELVQITESEDTFNLTESNEGFTTPDSNDFLSDPQKEIREFNDYNIVNGVFESDDIMDSPAFATDKIKTVEDDEKITFTQEPEHQIPRTPIQAHRKSEGITSDEFCSASILFDDDQNAPKTPQLQRMYQDFLVAAQDTPFSAIKKQKNEERISLDGTESDASFSQIKSILMSPPQVESTKTRLFNNIPKTPTSKLETFNVSVQTDMVIPTNMSVTFTITDHSNNLPATTVYPSNSVNKSYESKSMSSEGNLESIQSVRRLSFSNNLTNSIAYSSTPNNRSRARPQIKQVIDSRSYISPEAIQACMLSPLNWEKLTSQVDRSIGSSIY
ncbi:hypothetical protein PCE1_004054 [Barthelona sp. PCE]